MTDASNNQDDTPRKKSCLRSCSLLVLVTFILYCFSYLILRDPDFSRIGITVFSYRGATRYYAEKRTGEALLLYIKGRGVVRDVLYKKYTYIKGNGWVYEQKSEVNGVFRIFWPLERIEMAFRGQSTDELDHIKQKSKDATESIRETIQDLD